MMPESNPLIGVSFTDLSDPAKRYNIIAKLGPQELAALANSLNLVVGDVRTKQDEVKQTQEVDAFKAIGNIAKERMLGMAWDKLPKIILLPTSDGIGYTVQYVTEGKKSGKKTPGVPGVRAPSSISTGDITIRKIHDAMGGIAFFRIDGKDYEVIKDAVNALMQPVPKLDANGAIVSDADGNPVMIPGTVSEAERCWDIKHKGRSASDILTVYHPNDVVLIFNDKTEMTVAEAVARMKADRATAAAAATATATAA